MDLPSTNFYITNYYLTTYYITNCITKTSHDQTGHGTFFVVRFLVLLHFALFKFCSLCLYLGREVAFLNFDGLAGFDDLGELSDGDKHD